MWQKEIKPGERLAIYGSNCAAYINVLRAIWQKGGVAVLCPMRDPVPVIDDWLDFVDCRKIIILEPAVRTFESRHAQIFFHEGLKLPDFNFHPSAGTIMRTSGSSAKPKSVFHTVSQHLANARAVVEVLQVDQNSRWLLVLPLYHVSGLSIVIRCFLAQAEVVLPHAHLDIGKVLGEESVTHVSLVTTQLQRLLEDESNIKILRQLKAIVLGGSAVSTQLLKQIETLKLPVVRTYGLTEMASQVALSGQVLKEREIKIGVDHEIWVKGPMLFSGYVEGKTIFSAKDNEGWFHTGDLGFIDDKQSLHILGRLDNMFISGGENIYPETIEKEILSYPGIEEAVVIAHFDEKYGQCPVAFVKLKAQVDWDPQAWTLHLEKRLAKFKIPRQFFPWPNNAPSNGVKVPRSWFKNAKS